MLKTAKSGQGPPAPEGRKVADMTLNELTGKVTRGRHRNRVPSPLELVRSRTFIVASERMGEDIEITAYHNGYIVYRRGDDATVFPLHSCGDYEEKDVCGRINVIPRTVFAEQPWQIRAFLEGEDRLVHNDNNYRAYYDTLSRDASGGSYKENRYNVLDSDRGESDPLLILLKKEEEQNENEICRLNRALEELTDNQRFVLHRCVVEGKMHIEVAEELGLTRAGVSDTLRKALRRLRKFYGIADRKFTTNHFSRR